MLADNLCVRNFVPRVPGNEVVAHLLQSSEVIIHFDLQINQPIKINICLSKGDRRPWQILHVNMS